MYVHTQCRYFDLFVSIACTYCEHVMFLQSTCPLGHQSDKGGKKPKLTQNVNGLKERKTAIHTRVTGVPVDFTLFWYASKTVIAELSQDQGKEIFWRP